MSDFIAYYRVSTDRQGQSGLGLEAQRQAVLSHIHGHGNLLCEYTEIESGKRHGNRPQLLAALSECKRRGAVLLIARLDRLARNVAFIAQLMEDGVPFVAVDMPQANKFSIHILAAVAEYEREMISKRTIAALAAAKARGTRLGNPRPLEALKLANAAQAHLSPAPEVLTLIGALKQEGKSLRAIARHLNNLGNRTPRGCHWYASSVRNQLPRPV